MKLEYNVHPATNLSIPYNPDKLEIFVGARVTKNVNPDPEGEPINAEFVQVETYTYQPLSQRRTCIIKANYDIPAADIDSMVTVKLGGEVVVDEVKLSAYLQQNFNLTIA